MKFLNQARKYGRQLAVVGGGTLLPLLAMATPAGDYDAITAAVDFAAAGIAIAAIAALLAAPKVIMKGARMVLRMIG